MNKESIYRVPAERTIGLLTDPTFACGGRVIDLMDDDELLRRKVNHHALISREEDIISTDVIPRNIIQMVGMRERGVPIDVLSSNDAQLIFYCIDHFLTSQHARTYGQATEEQVRDYTNLAAIATDMLQQLDIHERSMMPNVVETKPTAASKEQLRFAAMFGKRFDMANATVNPDEQHQPEEVDTLPVYRSPWDRLTKELEQTNAPSWSSPFLHKG